ncbi:MAG TPA: mechanosensitive ion channel domain-containing protein [Methylomirabilota bacterium]|nr:mechanosensitive ion channel domain-containing protein [Methylomirabilota bacterium]
MDIRSLVIDLAVRYGFQILGAIVILGAGAIVGRWVGGLTDARLRSRAMEPPLRVLIVRALRILVMLFAFVVAIDKLGFQVAPLVAGIGVAGLGVGLALQGVLSNVSAGLTIIFTKPFRVGEYIEIVGVRGDVTTIELFSTTLLHADRSRVVIPNRKIVGEILHNFGHTRQLQLSVTVPHSADLTTALAAVTDVVQRNERVLKDPVAQIGIAHVGETGIRIAINPWVRAVDVVAAEGELNRALVEHLRGRGVSLGVSASDVRLVNGAGALARG